MLVIEAFTARSLAKVAAISAELPLPTTMACPLKVAVRIRPPQPHDGRVGNVKSVQVIDGVTLEAMDGSDSKQFVYDRVFWTSRKLRCCQAEAAAAMRKSINMSKHIKTFLPRLSNLLNISKAF